MGRPILDRLGEEVTGIVAPVSICMAITVALVRILNPEGVTNSGTVQLASIAYEEKTGDSAADKFGGAILNAIIFVGVVAGMTVVLFILFKYGCYKIIYGYMGFAVFNIFFFMAGALVLQLLQIGGVHVDAISLVFVLFNFSVVGTLGLFFMPIPLFMKQSYLVMVSIIVAFIFTYIPEWTAWMLLAIMALYDIVAVLVPGGPLRALVELAVERNQELPALVYEARPVSGPYERGTWRQNQNQQGAGGAAAQASPAQQRAAAAVAEGCEEQQLLLRPVSPLAARTTAAGAPVQPALMSRASGQSSIQLMPLAGGRAAGPLAEGQEASESNTTSSPDSTAPLVPGGSTAAAAESPARQRSPGGSAEPGTATPGGVVVADATSPRGEGQLTPTRPRSAATVQPVVAAGAPAAGAAAGADGQPARAETAEEREARRQARRERRAARQAALEREEEYDSGLPDSIKLGLGDFIFYSMLVGRAAAYDMMTVISAYLAIIAGLGLTLLCLAVFQKALPALPFSIALGMIFYFLTRIVLEPYAVPLSTHYVFY